MNTTAKSTAVKNPTHDMVAAKNLKFFREKFVSENQREAATLLGINQSTLSLMESGQRPINHKSLKAFLSKYDLNFEWLTTSNGNPKTTGKAKPSADSGLTAAFAEIKILTGAIKIFEANQSHLFKRIDMLEKKLDSLQRRMDKMEDGK
jgi:transcriptional regulator with XRE-family HTH domain